jgi:predicted O-linked N-acetylglucosamine transferase (SPINDLY family)
MTSDRGADLLLQVWDHANDLHKIISSYEQTNWNKARSLDGDWLHPADPAPIIQKIAAARRAVTTDLIRLPPSQHPRLAKRDAIHSASGRLRGMMFNVKLSPQERRAQTKHLRIFETNWRDPQSFLAFTILSYYFQPFELPLQTDIKRLSFDQLNRYLHFTVRQPHIMQAEDEAAYVAYYEKLCAWLLKLLTTPKPIPEKRLHLLLHIITHYLTFGACYYIDQSTASLVRLRGQLLEEILKHIPDHCKIKAARPRLPAAIQGDKLRLGVISRNIGDYTDTRALFGMFSGFDPKRYDLYWYSLDVLDPTTLHDVQFYRKLYARLHKLTGLRQSAARNAQQVISDQLDFLVVGSALSFGLGGFDQLVAHRLARVQIGFNPMVPGSSGLSSYDYLITTPPADAAAEANYRAEATEKLRFMRDPLVWYDKRPASQADGKITRKDLGIPANTVLYFSGAAANKQMPATIECWFEILRRAPNSMLMLMPFNPAWGGYYIGLTFLNRLQQMLRQNPDIDPQRIKIIREVTPAEGNQFLLLSDIYLGSFPHGGATSVMLALRHGVPVVARRAAWLRSTSDPSLLASLGLEALIGADNSGFIEIAVKLAKDKVLRTKIKQHIAAKIETAAFFRPEFCSRRLQKIFDELASDHDLA